MKNQCDFFHFTLVEINYRSLGFIGSSLTKPKMQQDIKFKGTQPTAVVGVIFLNLY